MNRRGTRRTLGKHARPPVRRLVFDQEVRGRDLRSAPRARPERSVRRCSSASSLHVSPPEPGTLCYAFINGPERLTRIAKRGRIPIDKWFTSRKRGQIHRFHKHRSHLLRSGEVYRCQVFGPGTLFCTAYTGLEVAVRRLNVACPPSQTPTSAWDRESHT